MEGVSCRTEDISNLCEDVVDWKVKSRDGMSSASICLSRKLWRRVSLLGMFNPESRGVTLSIQTADILNAQAFLEYLWI